MTEGQTLDVLICGAGAAGLALAIDLARRGVRFRIIDAAPRPFGGSRGKGIQPRTQEVFDDLGILDRVVALGGVYPPKWEYSADGRYVEATPDALFESTPAAPFCLPLMTPQFLTEQVMRERLVELGGAVEFGRRLTGFEQDGERVVASVTGARGEERVHARYLVGADGGRSFVRHALGIGFPGKTLGVRAVVADVALAGLERCAWHVFNGKSMDSMLHLCPLGGTDLFQLQAPVPHEGEVDVDAAALTALVNERTARKDLRVDAVIWASVYQMNARLADRYRVGRVLLAGDAAHIHPPTGGQGLNTSVQDSYNLGWKLAAVLAGAPDALLDSYEAERRPVAAGVLGVSAQLLDAAQRGDTRRGKELQQLDIEYRQSALTLPSPERGRRVAAGARAPDAPLRGATGQRRRLFDLFAGPHWTLLGYEAEGALARQGLRVFVIGDSRELRDDEGHFAAAYGVEPGDWVLVRPDGYIAALVTTEELSRLQGHLDGLLGTARPSAMVVADRTGR